MKMTTPRKLPNIVITGTPGVGKTTHCELVAERTGLKHLSVNEIVKDKECHEGWDEEYQSWIVDEDKVCVFFFFCLCSFLVGGRWGRLGWDINELCVCECTLTQPGQN